MPTRSSTENGSPHPILPLFRECVALFTGDWPKGFHPRWKRRPWWHLVTTVLSLFGSVAGSSFILTMSLTFWPLLLLSWMLTVHGARKAYLVICHYAVHGNMTGNTRWDRVLVEVLSTLLTTSHFARYRQDHVHTHHGPPFATVEDSDLQFLLALGFRPGMSRDALWRHLHWTLVSPRFHLLFLWFRLQVNFIAAPWYRRIMASGYAIAAVTFLVLTNAWLLWLVAWVVPLFPLYHVAALLQFVSEHCWLQVHPNDNPASRTGETMTNPKLVRGRLTFGRFVGDPLPGRDLPLGQCLWSWGRWVSRLLVLHIPTRLCVLPGDLCQHDWHHRHPQGDWSNACYERQRDLAASCPGWPEPYDEVWGLGKAIDVVFAGLASLPPLAACTWWCGAMSGGAFGLW
jgi:hypothetical protein